MNESSQAHQGPTQIPQPIQQQDPSTRLAQAAVDYPPFSQMRIISMPPDGAKQPRKHNYQKFNDEEDLWIVKKAVENREQFKNGSKREFWRRVQDELSQLTGKQYSPFDRHIVNIMKKRRDRILKMPQQYLDWLDKWIEWHDTYVSSGHDIHLTLPDNWQYEDPSLMRGKGASKKRKRNTTRGPTEPRRPPGRPPRSSAPVPTQRDFITVGDDVPLNGTYGTPPAPVTPMVNGPVNDQYPPSVPSAAPPGFGPQPYANVGGLLGNAANELDDNWLESVEPNETNIDEDLNRIVEKLKASLDKTSPRTAANSSLLLAIIGLVRDNRGKIIDLEESIQKEQKKRKWNDDVVWSMVRNKCAELDLDYNARRRAQNDAQAGNAPPPDTETYALTRELKVSTSELESQMGRVLSDLRQANDDITQLREVDRQHRQYIDGLKNILKQQRSRNANGARDPTASAEISALQEELANLRQERDLDKETISHQK